MTATTVQGAVERFLDDAERAAHQGNVGRAHQLMLLALDTRPGDPQVLMRVSLVRDTLAAILGEERPGSESEPKHRTKPKTARRRAERGRDREGGVFDDVFHPIPGFDGNPTEDTYSGSQGAAPEVVIRGLPTASGTTGAPGAGPTIGLANDDDDDSGWVAVQPVARVVAATPAPVVVETKRRPRLVLYGLWLVLAVAAMAVLVVVVAPGFVNGLVNRATNPLAAAQEAMARHDYPGAAKRAREALAHGADPVQGNIILGQALLAEHDVPGGREALGKAVAVDSAGTWQTSMQIGSLLLDAGDTATASKAYYSAYLKSAPMSQFLTISRGRLLAGDLKLPAALLSELASRRDPGYLADSAQIMGLYRRVQSAGHP